MLAYSGGGWTLAQEVIAHAAAPPVGSVEIVNRASGGSFSCAQNRPADSDRSYWWDVAADAHGPLLTDALAEIAARTADRPTVIVWDQGQADTSAAAGLIIGLPPARAVANYEKATTAVFAALRSAVGPSTPVLLVPLGRRTASAPLGMERIRQTQLALAATLPGVRRGPEVYDLALTDSVHPDRSGMRVYGARIGQCIAKMAHGAARIFDGPSITSVALAAPRRVDVTIEVEDGDELVSPAHPWGFRIEDPARPGLAIEVDGQVWAGTTLQFHLATPVSAPVLFYPYDWGEGFDPSCLVRGAVSGKPLQSYYRAGWSG